MDEEPKTNEESWSVEPPKQESKKRKALRVALIVAALGAVALVGAVLIVGNSIQKQFESMPIGGLISGNPEHKKIEYQQKKDAKKQKALDVGDNIGNRGGD